MSVLLPTGLPKGFVSEPATGAHAAEVFEVCAAEQTAVFGFSPDTEEDMRADLEPPEGSQTTQHVIRDVDGAVVQWWAVVRVRGDPIFWAWIRSHPRLAPDTGDELAQLGWAMMLGWIRQHAPDDQEQIQVHSGCPAGGDFGKRHLENAGFAHRRTFWEMIGPVTDATRSAPPVPGMVIEASRDEATMHRILNEAFAGHWGYTALEFDDWLAWEKSISGFDPALWFVATVDGTPAAVMLLTRRAETEGAMFVSELATLPEFQRRGIASALLAHSFDLAAREGLAQVSLFVDSENTRDAPSVYRRAGFEVRCAFDAYTQELTR